MSDAPALPEELLSLIFANLQVSGRVESPVEDRLQRRTLATICRVNKQCCRLAQPILYHSIRLGGYDGATRKLWESVVQRPELASLVHAMQLDCWEFPQIEEGFSEEEGTSELEQHETDVSDALKDATRKAMKPLSSTLAPYYEKVESYQLSGVEDGMLAFLVARCTNLEYLEIALPFGFRTYSCVFSALEYMATGSVDGPQTHPKLDEIFLQHWDTEGAFDATIASSFFNFPSLRVFRGHMMDWAERPGVIVLPQSNLREVHLTESLIEAGELHAFLAHCPKLEVVSIEWGSATVGDCRIEYQHIGQVFRDLPHIAKNLKKVVLEHGNAFSIEYGDDDFYAPLGSLKTLQSLEHLAVNALALAGEDDEEDDNYPNFEQLPLEDMLPESLRTLDILRGHREEPDEFDKKLYTLMSDPGHKRLSTINMYRRITEHEVELERVGWSMMEGAYESFVLKRIVQDAASA